MVVPRLNPVRFDGGDIPSIAGVERRSQRFLTDGVRAGIGAIVTEAQQHTGFHRARSPTLDSPRILVARRRRTQPRSHGRRPWLGRLPVPSLPRQRPAPTIPARRREARSRRSRSPHPALPRRIRPRMPTARLLAAAGQYPTAQGRRGTTHPRAIPSAVRDWLDADH
jgi:hypothetical protein